MTEPTEDASDPPFVAAVATFLYNPATGRTHVRTLPDNGRTQILSRAILELTVHLDIAFRLGVALVDVGDAAKLAAAWETLKRARRTP